MAGAKRFWVWLYYKPTADLSVLEPWSQWGYDSGSGSDGHESDISWDYGREQTALERARKMHQKLSRARVSHRVEVVDIEDQETIATFGRWRARRRR